MIGALTGDTMKNQTTEIQTREDAEFETLKALVLSRPVVKNETDQAVSDWMVKSRKAHTAHLQS